MRQQKTGDFTKKGGFGVIKEEEIEIEGEKEQERGDAFNSP